MMNLFFIVQEVILNFSDDIIPKNHYQVVLTFTLGMVFAFTLFPLKVILLFGDFRAFFSGLIP